MNRIPIIAIVSFLSIFISSAEGHKYIYNQISQKDGLLTIVNCIYKEPDKNIWIGTHKGLYSFDGDRLKRYKDDVTGRSEVFRIFSDAGGGLWALTGTGAAIYDRRQDRFVKVSGSEAAKGPMFSFHLCPEGIFIGSLGKVFFYDYGKREYRIFTSFADDGFEVRDMSLIDGSTLLCTGLSGAMTVDMETGLASPAPFVCPKEICASMVDREGRIWISAYNSGIMIFDRKGNELKRYNTGNSVLSNDVVLCMVQKDSLMWLGTDGGGINVLDQRDGSIEVLSHTAGDPSSFPANSVKSMYVDQYGNIFAGSVRDGLIRIRSSRMKTFSDIHIGEDHGLSNPSVLSLHQEPGSPFIWIGTDGEGINRYDQKTGLFRHYPGTLKSKVASIATYSEDELLLSVYSKGLYLFGKDTGKIRRYNVNIPELDHYMRHLGRTANIMNESDGGILLLGYGMHRLTGKGVCEIVPSDGKPSAGNFFCIATADGYSYIHDLYNIYRIAPGAAVMDRLFTVHGTRINCASIAPSGTIWAVTENGLMKFWNGRQETVQTNLFNAATSVIADNDGRVWIGAENRLFAYLPEENSFAMFGESDGVTSNEYLKKARLLSKEGHIYMGGVHGLLFIDRDFVIDTEGVPHLRLSGFMVDGAPVEPAKNIRIAADSKMMEITVASEEKDIFRKKMYRYSVDSQVYESDTPLLTLRPLPPPGRHSVMVSCSKSNGEWTTPEEILTFTVLQPWYSSWWFIISCILAGITAAAVVIFAIFNAKNNRLKLAMKEHEKEIYEDKVRMLINISHEIRTPLTLVMASIKRIMDSMDKEDADFPAISRIYRQSKRMKEIINTVLDIRKMEVGQDCLKLREHDINSWISETASDFIEESRNMGIEIVLRLSPTAGTLSFDMKKCSTVLINLLINAIKHSKEGDLITVSSEVRENSVRISVSDQGPGLGDVDPQKLFTRFYQGEDEKSGSGIGLSYSRILVEIHGGEIGACNNTSGGATFWFELPSGKPEGDISEEPKEYLNEIVGNAYPALPSGSPALYSDTRRTRLLLADDSHELMDFMEESLKDSFSVIYTAHSGKEAMETVKSKMPDIVVTDISMPDGDGYSLCRAIKDNPKLCHIPVILLTAMEDESNMQEGYRSGADAFLGKPFEIGTLYTIICSQLKIKDDIRKRYLDKSSMDAAISSEDEGFIVRLNAIIEENMASPELDISTICKSIGISRASLYNKLKAVSGMGANEYISKIRMETAIRMIEETDIAFGDIADRTGYSTSSYFSTAFKQYTGMTPTQYRNKTRKTKNTENHEN